MEKNKGLKNVGIISILIGVVVAVASIIMNMENLSIAFSMAEVFAQQSAGLVVSLILVIILGAVSGVVCALSGIFCIIQKNKTLCTVLSAISLIVAIASAIFFIVESIEIVLLIPVAIISAISLVMSLIAKKQ